MSDVSLEDVKKLRAQTGAGITDCKNAIREANGDLSKALDLIRERGKAIANKRQDREATEGVVLAGQTQDGKTAVLLTLNSETDFVARNADFIALAQGILDEALRQKPADLAALLKMKVDGETAAERVVQFSGVTGEKLELSQYAIIEAPYVDFYIHPGNRLASIIGAQSDAFNRDLLHDLAIQVAGMNPLSVDADSMPEELLRKEREIGREQARLEGKPDAILDKIAEGRLSKFLKENTLMSQLFVMGDKETVEQHVASVDKSLKVLSFARFSLQD